MKHTPTPWEVRRDIKTQDLSVVGENGFYLLTMHTDGPAGIRLGDVNFIVQAVNSHYELVEVCEMLANYKAYDSSIALTKIVAKAKQAISKAKGE